MRYDCILPSPERRLLLVQDEGRWSLPHVTCEKGWLADAVADIQAGFTARYGVDVAVLRGLSWTDAVRCELELQSDVPVERTDRRWVAPDDPMIHQLAPEQVEAVNAWREDRGMERRVAPWQRRGWLNEAREWIVISAHRAGFGIAREVTQIKAGWNGSCVLRVETADGMLYFKASPARVPGEPAVVRALSASWSRHVPQLVDADDERCWLLMRQIDGAPISPWSLADLRDTAHLMARIQVDQAAQVGRWTAMGCPDRALTSLEAGLERLLVDIPAALCEAGILTASEREELASFVPAAAAMCRSLEAFAIPSRSIHHEDFRDGNACRTPTGDIVLIDWNDTVISHPFFTIQRFLWFVRPPAGTLRHVILDDDRDAARRTLRDAYLEPFAAFEPTPRLLDAFRLSALLAPLYDVMRFDAAGDTDETFRHGLTPEDSRNARYVMEHILEVVRARVAVQK